MNRISNQRSENFKKLQRVFFISSVVVYGIGLLVLWGNPASGFQRLFSVGTSGTKLVTCLLLASLVLGLYFISMLLARYLDSVTRK
jgi:hypothetical protein